MSTPLPNHSTHTRPSYTEVIRPSRDFTMNVILFVLFFHAIYIASPLLSFDLSALAPKLFGTAIFLAKNVRGVVRIGQFVENAAVMAGLIQAVALTVLAMYFVTFNSVRGITALRDLLEKYKWKKSASTRRGRRRTCSSKQSCWAQWSGILSTFLENMRRLQRSLTRPISWAVGLLKAQLPSTQRGRRPGHSLTSTQLLCALAFVHSCNATSETGMQKNATSCIVTNATISESCPNEYGTTLSQGGKITIILIVFFGVCFLITVGIWGPLHSTWRAGRAQQPDPEGRGVDGAAGGLELDNLDSDHATAGDSDGDGDGEGRTVRLETSFPRIPRRVFGFLQELSTRALRRGGEEISNTTSASSVIHMAGSQFDGDSHERTMSFDLNQSPPPAGNTDGISGQTVNQANVLTANGEADFNQILRLVALREASTPEARRNGVVLPFVLDGARIPGVDKGRDDIEQGAIPGRCGDDDLEYGASQDGEDMTPVTMREFC